MIYPPPATKTLKVPLPPSKDSPEQLKATTKPSVLKQLHIEVPVRAAFGCLCDMEIKGDQVMIGETNQINVTV